MKQIITILFLIVSFTSFGQNKSIVTVSGTGGGSNVGDSVKKNTDTLGIYKTLVYPNIVNTTTNTSNILLKRNISDTAGSAGVTTIFQTNKSKDSLQTNINLKAPLASPTFTGTPAAPTATLLDSSTTLVTTAHLRNNALPIAVSEIFPGRYSYMLYPQKKTNFETPIEFLNIGSSALTSDSSHWVKTGIVKNNWSFLSTWNMKYDSTNLNWKSPIIGKASYCSELGLEGVTLHAVTAGSNFSGTWHEQFQVRALGVDVGSGNTGPTTGIYLQAKAPLFFRYRGNSTYTDDTDPWTGGSGSNWTPFIWLTSEETKGGAPSIVLESNHTTGVTGQNITFRKSQGTWLSKTAAATNSNPGLIIWALYDGAKYLNTARILTFAEAAPTSGVAPQRFAVQTSVTDSTGLTTRLSVSAAGITSLYSGSAVASASAITPTGNIFHVTGTTTITSITSTNIIAGATIRIIFDGALTFTDGSNLVLAGNFVTTADDTITLTYDGTSWYEMGRSIN